jgi:uncharacterized protein YecA (UPF0149 family)
MVGVLSGGATEMAQIAKTEVPSKTRPEPGFAASQIIRAAPKIGRNDPCPCGSGRKYKKCCGV